jgi:cell division FtsZ-interacting protein ZapD
MVKSASDDAIAIWEGEGGSAAPMAEPRMFGTVNQIAWAEQIKTKVNAEFDRVRKVLESVADKHSPEDGSNLPAIIQILEDKRRMVMGNEQAGYFIHDWQELGAQVRQLIVADPRYKAIKADHA